MLPGPRTGRFAAFLRGCDPYVAPIMETAPVQVDLIKHTGASMPIPLRQSP